MPMICESTHSNLAFTGCLPLAWRELSTLPKSDEFEHQEKINLHILHILFALEIHAGDYGEDPSNAASASELKRLDFKVSLLLEMIGYLFAAQQTIPPECPLTLTASELHWRAGVAPSVDVPLRLDLYCNLIYPRPLVLYAHVSEIHPIDNDYRIKATLQQLGEPLQEALERYIFLQHRRTIANQRGNSQR
ncbi:MAG: PilZ domain-containing protein [Candidatus Competibacteraceae bacterium]|nr:PilZ domain-containing protein [Candidatus Competibacteraceae bacterium]